MLPSSIPPPSNPPPPRLPPCNHHRNHKHIRCSLCPQYSLLIVCCIHLPPAPWTICIKSTIHDQESYRGGGSRSSSPTRVNGGGKLKQHGRTTWDKSKEENRVRHILNKDVYIPVNGWCHDRKMDIAIIRWVDERHTVLHIDKISMCIGLPCFLFPDLLRVPASVALTWQVVENLPAWILVASHHSPDSKSYPPPKAHRQLTHPSSTQAYDMEKQTNAHNKITDIKMIMIVIKIIKKIYLLKKKK